ncbi:hypothetical protein BCON_0383g00100 [Botryotinia convoluta]|uniref:Uncharacterized protein n=1 Tax=Botryotinia convoluta TaxID=54673 RepID=A0A4Z1HKN5_9HELO|nr:hypothetical protein BCON_0383g00100 [Botryotinia convoluta]
MDIETENGNTFLDCKQIKSDTGTTIVTYTQSTLLNSALEFWDLHYTLIGPAGFYTTAASQLGIERDWIAFGDWEVPKDCIVLRETLTIIPRTAGPEGSSPVSGIVVTKPKTVIEAAMPNIQDIGTEVEEENKKNLNLEISGKVLMVVPINDEGEWPNFDGITNIALLTNLVRDSGNAALTAYEILEDPPSATFSIKGILGGGF